MHSNYTGVNPNTIPSYPAQSSSQNYANQNTYSGNQDDRFVAGGFLGPFILGGITGGLLAPAFYNPGYGYGRPVYNTYYYPNPPYYYGPYYR